MPWAGGYFGNFEMGSRPYARHYAYAIHARFSFKPVILPPASRNWNMRKGLIAVGLSAALLAATSSAASAGWHHGSYDHRGPGPVLGLVGGIVVGVATIATLPFAILGAALSPAPPPPPPPAYYGPPQQQGYYGPPPQQGYYGQPQQQGYYGPQRQQGYYGPPQGYNAPPQQQGYYGPPPGYSGY
jgi:hypothetical protein